MIRIFTILLPAWVILPACTPSPHPSEEQQRVLAEVLVEIHLAQAREKIGLDSLSQPTDTILAAYGLDSVAFARLLDLHIDSDGAFDDAYEDALDRLSEEGYRQGESEGVIPFGIQDGGHN